MFNVLDSGFMNLNAAMIGYQISLVYNVEEAKPGTFEYTFIAVMRSQFSNGTSNGITAISHGPTPELAVHNVIDLYKLTNSPVLLPEQGPQLEEHNKQSQEALRLLRSMTMPWDTAGTPSARLHYMFTELDKRFPSAVDPFSSEPPEPKYLEAIDDLISSPENAEVFELDGFGSWVDEITNTNRDRDLKVVVGRALEEMTEACLAAGLNYGQVMSHAADAWHNQCLKESAKRGHTIWPSQLHEPVIDHKEVLSEIADLFLTVFDAMWLIAATRKMVRQAMVAKFHKLKNAHAEGRLNITASRTFYIKKDHVK